MSRNRKAHARARRSAAARNTPPIKGGARFGSAKSLARRLHCERLEDRRLLAVVTVDTVDDTIDFDDGYTSLREAIFATNTVPGPDEIRFDPALFTAAPRTILLTHGELAITDSLTLTGPGAELLTIDASGNDPTPDRNNGDGSRVFLVDDGGDSFASITIDGLRLSGGDLRLSSGDFSNYGGAIRSVENLTITRSVISDNSAFGGGGVYQRTGMLSVADSIFKDNRAAKGGGIYNVVSAVTLQQSDLRDNMASRAGGGMFSSHSPLTLVGGTISGNSALAGGGLYLYNRTPSADPYKITITGATISNNTAMTSSGGGIRHRGSNRPTAPPIEVRASTITGNKAASQGGGVYFEGYPVIIADSIISGNSAGGIGGGAYLFSVSATVERSVITQNYGAGGGAGLYFRGRPYTVDGVVQPSFSVNSCTISGNTTADNAVTSGGGICFSGANGYPTAVISQCVISENSAYFGGGVIFRGFRQNCTMYIYDTLITRNHADRGGGIYSFNDVIIESSTVSGNSARIVGGIQGRQLLLRHSTVTGNYALPDAGSEFFAGGVEAGNTRLDHAIVAGNLRASGAAGDLGGDVDAMFSLIGSNSRTNLAETPVGSPDANGNLIGGPVHGVIDPLLGPLADNGGSTLTHALLPGSPAIGAGDAALRPGVGATPEFDQRGAPFSRVVGARIDIGAVEQTGVPFVVDTLVDESDGDYRRGDLSLREAIELANAQPGADVIVFDPALFTAGPGTILLTHGELAITESLTLTGPGAALLTIDASGNDPTPDVNDGNGSRVLNFASAAPTLHRLTVTGVRLTGGDAAVAGGAISANAPLTLEHVIIVDNSAARGGGISATALTLRASEVSGNAATYGAGLYASSGDLLVEDTVMSGNIAEQRGGGIYTRSLNMRLSNVTIVGNKAGNAGGGINHMQGLGRSEIRNSLFANNDALLGGGGIYWQGGEILIFQTQVSDNRRGGGLYLQSHKAVIDSSIILSNRGRSGGGVNHTGQLEVIDSLISGNVATGSGGGILSGNLTIRRSTVSGNSAGVLDAPRVGEEFPVVGGGISAATLMMEASTVSNNFAADAGGGVHVSSSGSTIINSTITGNSANQGGGVYGRYGALVWILNSTVTENSAVTHRGVVGRGGGVVAPRLLMRNSIVAGNHSSGFGPDASSPISFVRYSMLGDNSGVAGLAEAPVGAPDERNSLIGGPVHGVIDPLLGPLADNGGATLTHSLLPGSPAIGAGGFEFPAPMFTTPEFDQRGAPFTRVAGARIDIGAFEAQAEGGALNADFDLNGLVDGGDFLAWQRNVGRASGATIRQGDATADGDVEGNDLAVWRGRFGGGDAGLSAVGSQLSARGETADRNKAAAVGFEWLAVSRDAESAERSAGGEERRVSATADRFSEKIEYVGEFLRNLQPRFGETRVHGDMPKGTWAWHAEEGDRTTDEWDAAFAEFGDVLRSAF